MMDLSIIIPVGKREDDFKLIKQIKEKFKGCEIILVIDEDNQLFKQAKIEVDQLSFLSHSSRAKALNAGVRLSTRNHLWFLHLDSNIENISSADLMELSEFELSTFLLQFDQANCWWIAAGANFRTKAFGIPFGDQSFLMSKKLFNFIGPFNERLLEGEDHEFIWRTKSLNIKLNIINKNIITSAKKYLNQKIAQTLKTLSIESDLGAVRRGECVGRGIEVEATGQSDGHDRVRRGHETQRVGRPVVALREVAVEGVDDGVRLVGDLLGPLPLADARSAGVGEHSCADRFEVGQEAVALDGGSDLLGARCDEELALGS